MKPLDKQTRSQLQAFVANNHHTEWFPVNDAYVVEYFGVPVFTITDDHIVLNAGRRNYTTMMRINNLLEIFGCRRRIIADHREWYVENTQTGATESFRNNFAIARKERTGNANHCKVVRRLD